MKSVLCIRSITLLLSKSFLIDFNQHDYDWNYFKVAVRKYSKRKLYSFINAFGLRSIGLAFCMLIYFLYSWMKRVIDQFHEN
ncbi:MAG: hypothetical protein U5K54_05360 [Cytophagales bacterium]|nr:hypothetical protein [Cytophagales bacterium]